MTKQEIQDKVNTFLTEDFEVEASSLREDALLKQDVGLDSLDWVDIVVSIEREFGFKPNPAELKKTRTLGDLYNYILSQVNG